MNKNFPDYYRILQISRDATTEEICRSFRKLAKEHHPDKNGNSTESHMHFRIILEAYEILSSETNRNQYDTYIKTSTIMQTQQCNNGDHGKKDKVDTLETLRNQLNYIFWEIEDLYSKTGRIEIKKRYNCYSIEEWLAIILAFFDTWVLTPSGYSDYFFTARQIDMKQPFNPVTREFRADHLPYTDYIDYFYQMRRRMDKFLQGINNSLLAKKIPDHGIPLIDAVYESIRLSYYYLGSIRNVLSGKSHFIAVYTHTHKAFGGHSTDLLFM